MWVWVCLDLHENVETRERVLRAWWWNIEEWRHASGVLKIGVYGIESNERKLETRNPTPVKQKGHPLWVQSFCTFIGGKKV